MEPKDSLFLEILGIKAGASRTLCDRRRVVDPTCSGGGLSNGPFGRNMVMSAATTMAHAIARLSFPAVISH